MGVGGNCNRLTITASVEAKYSKMLHQKGDRLVKKQNMGAGKQQV